MCVISSFDPAGLSSLEDKFYIIHGCSLFKHLYDLRMRQRFVACFFNGGNLSTHNVIPSVNIFLLLMKMVCIFSQLFTSLLFSATSSILFHFFIWLEDIGFSRI